MASKKRAKPAPADDRHSFSIVDTESGDVVARRLRAKEALDRIEDLRNKKGKDKFRLVNDAHKSKSTTDH